MKELARDFDPLVAIVAAAAIVAIGVAVLIVFGLLPALVELNAFMALG